jgi:DNA-binding MarR family transcriptional regulator
VANKHIDTHHGAISAWAKRCFLQVERATLSSVVALLVRKGLVEQVPDSVDQRQKLLRMTEAGTKLWSELPDLEVIRNTAFDGLDAAAVATAVEVLKTATERLEKLTERK